MRTLVICGVVGVAAVSVFNSVSRAASYNTQEFVISEGSVDNMSLFMDGDYAVFRDTMMMRVYGYKLSQRELFELPVSSSDAMGLRKKGRYAVWSPMSGGLQGYDLENRELFVITAGSMIDWMSLAQSERYVFWVDMDSFQIKGFDLVARQTFVIGPSMNVMAGSLRAAGNYAVWGDMSTGVLLAYDAAAAEVFTLSAGTYDTMNLKLSDTYAVWPDIDGRLYAYVLDDRELVQVAVTGVDMMGIKLAGQFVVWKDMLQMQVRGYDLIAREGFMIDDSDSGAESLTVSPTYAVWKQSAQMNLLGYNLPARQKLPMNIPFPPMSPSGIIGDFLIWQDYDMDTQSTVIKGYDLQDLQPFAVASLGQSAPAFNPIARDGYVLWQVYYDAMPMLMGGQIFKVVNDTCEDAVELTEGVPYLGSTEGATGWDISRCGFRDEWDVWHRFTPTVGGAVTLSTEGSAFDTTVAVYNACGGMELACNDDFSLDHTQSKVELTAVKGKTYLIRVAGFDNQVGAYQVLVSGGVCSDPPLSDVNGDCKVDMGDLSILAAEWLNCGLNPVSACGD